MASMKIHILRCGTIHCPQAGSPWSGRGTFPIWCYLIEHPAHGLLLVDTGLGTLPLPPRLARYYRPEPQPDIAAQLKKRGVAPRDLTAVLLSDLDIDHTGGIHALRAAKRFLVSEEEYYWTARAAFARRQPRALWENDVKFEAYYLRAGIGPARHSLDLFGDGSVLSVLTHGHTFGNCTTLLRWNGRTLLLAGNAVRSGRSLADDSVYHRSQQDKTVQWLREMRRDPSCAGIFATHDPDERERSISL